MDNYRITYLNLKTGHREYFKVPFGNESLGFGQSLALISLLKEEQGNLEINGFERTRAKFQKKLIKTK